MVLKYMKLKAAGGEGREIKSYTSNEDEFLGKLPITMEGFWIFSLKRVKRPFKDTCVSTDDCKVILFISFQLP